MQTIYEATTKARTIHQMILCVLILFPSDLKKKRKEILTLHRPVYEIKYAAKVPRSPVSSCVSQSDGRTARFPLDSPS